MLYLKISFSMQQTWSSLYSPLCLSTAAFMFVIL